MTKTKITTSQYVSGKLRQAVHDGDLTDYNSSNRTSTFGNWIYPDKPALKKLLSNKNNFPRISVTLMDKSSPGRLGMQSTLYRDTVQLLVTVWTVKNLVCYVNIESGEDHTFVDGTDKYALDDVPISLISGVDGIMDDEAHTFIKGTDYQLIDNDYDGMYDTIEWIGDIPDDATDFTVAYGRKAEGEELVNIIAQDVDYYFREEWNNWTANELRHYKLLTAHTVLDESNGVLKHDMIVEFTGINIGRNVSID